MLVCSTAMQTQSILLYPLVMSYFSFELFYDQTIFNQFYDVFLLCFVACLTFSYQSLISDKDTASDDGRGRAAFPPLLTPKIPSSLVVVWLLWKDQGRCVPVQLFSQHHLALEIDSCRSLLNLQSQQNYLSACLWHSFAYMIFLCYDLLEPILSVCCKLQSLIHGRNDFKQ